MTLQPIVASGDGPRVTVNTLVKQPTMIPKRVIRMLDGQFIADSLFRDGGNAPSGVVVYNESTPQFPEGEVGVREEFGEYPVITTVDGQQKVAIAVDRGFSVLISEEMRRRNQMDRVNLQITQGKNLMLRTWDTVVKNALLGNAAVPTMPASGLWTNAATKIRTDLLDAKYAVSVATLDAVTAPDDWFGFAADTAVMSSSTAQLFLSNDDIEKQYHGNTADQSIRYKGKLPSMVYDLNILVARSGWPDDKVWIGERKTVGFVADEVALNSTPLYSERPSTKTWRSDTGRTSAVGVDQPKAGIIITGVQ